VIETLILGFFGLMAGVVSSLPFFIYYHDNPIRLTGEYGDIYESFGMEPLMGFSLNPSIFMNQFILVGIMLLFVLIYPTFKISKLNIINSIRL
jgi:ABC-type antimicrobial peptide transport system permease subunit